MKRAMLYCLAICLALASCEKKMEPSSLPPGWNNNLFAFAIFDSEGNNLTMQDDFNPEELLLEYEGKIFTPKQDEFQRVDDSKPNDPDYFYNSIIFEMLPHYGGEPVAWRVWGHLYLGEPARYIIRYRGNEWVVDYLAEKRKGDKENPKMEAVVNGVKIEEENVYNSDKSEYRIIFVLRTK